MYGLVPCFVPEFNAPTYSYCPQNLWTSLDYMSHLTLLRIHNTITSLMLSSTPLILETGGFEVSTSLESGCLGIKQAFYLMLHLV